MRKLIACLLIAAASTAATAQLQITEWMYSGTNGEFFELTNVGPSPVDMTGATFVDNDILHTPIDISAIGTVAAGQSVILTETDAATFRTAWGLESSVVVLNYTDFGLGRNDSIIITDSLSNLIDSLAYGDQDEGTVRTQNASAWAFAVDLDTPASFVLSTVGDAQGSWTSTGGDIGNPGSYLSAPVPEPSTYAAIAGVLALGLAIRRRKQA